MRTIFRCGRRGVHRTASAKRSVTAADGLVEVPEESNAGNLLLHAPQPLVIGVGANTEKSGVVVIETRTGLQETVQNAATVRPGRRLKKTQNDVSASNGVKVKAWTSGA